MMALDSSTSIEDSLYFWTNSVSSTGIFIKNSLTEIPEGQDGIPEGWTVITAS